MVNDELLRARSPDEREHADTVAAARADGEPTHSDGHATCALWRKYTDASAYADAARD